MKFRFAVFAALGLLISQARASEEQPKPPGFFSRMFHQIHLPQKPDWLRLPHLGGKKSDLGQLKKLALDLQLSPQPLKLSEARQLHAAVVLTNKSKKFVGLEFPTTQRVEVLIRDKMGKLVTQWSEDRTFENAPSYVGLNPGERLEYSASLPTRDLRAGENYTLEGFFPNFDELKARRSIVPQR